MVNVWKTRVSFFYLPISSFFFQLTTVTLVFNIYFAYATWISQWSQRLQRCHECDVCVCVCVLPFWLPVAANCLLITACRLLVCHCQSASVIKFKMKLKYYRNSISHFKINTMQIRISPSSYCLENHAAVPQ